MWQGEGFEGEPGQVPKGLSCCSLLLLPKKSAPQIPFFCSLSKTSWMSPRARALVEMAPSLVQEGKIWVPFGKKTGVWLCCPGPAAAATDLDGSPFPDSKGRVRRPGAPPAAAGPRRGAGAGGAAALWMLPL